MKKDVIKRVISVFVCVMITAAFITPGSGAAFKSEYSSPVRYGSSENLAEKLQSFVDTEKLRSYLFESFYSEPEYVDLSGFDIPSSEYNALYNFIWRQMPELFHVSKLSHYVSGGKIVRIGAVYSVDAQQYDTMYKRCAGAAQVLISGIQGNDALNDAEKALLIHDRIALSCEYDFAMENENRYNMYGCLYDGVCVCDGYAKAYNYLLRLVGIKSVDCESTKLNHAWNIVYVDGVPYHVDVTWDDLSWGTSNGVAGGVRHDNFLLSDSGIVASGHNADDFLTIASSNKYEGCFWTNVKSAFCLVNGNIYYFNNASQSLFKYDRDGEDKLLGELKSVWSAGDGYSWVGNFGRLASDGVSLFCTTSSSVYKYDITRDLLYAVCTPEKDKHEGIFGFEYSDGCFILEISQSAPGGGDAEIRTVKYPYAESVPSAELECENADNSSKQTVSVSITAQSGVKGYYWGQSVNVTENTFVETAQTQLELDVTEYGTYYFAAVDMKNDISDVQSLTFCLTVLHPGVGRVREENILTLQGFVIDLPQPECDTAEFLGWAASEGGEPIGKSIVVHPDGRLDYYAVYDNGSGIFGNVVCKAANAYVVICDGQMNELAIVAVKDGKYSCALRGGEYFIKIKAEGYHTFVYKTNVSGQTSLDAELIRVGDVNGDGNVNNKDVVLLFRFCSKSGVAVTELAADCNGDNAINNKDVVLLFRSVSGSGVKLTEKEIKMY